MKNLILSIVLMPTVFASTDGSTAGILTNFDSRQSHTGQSKHNRDHRRKIKVTVERNVDDDSSSGYNTKTVTIERNVDDDNSDGSNSGKYSSRMKTKSLASSPYELPRVKATSTSTTAATGSSNSKHHKNGTITDDSILGGEGGDNDDDDTLNATTPISDMMEILNEYMNHDNASDTNGFGTTGGKIVLPPEHEPSETWIVAIMTLFCSMAISLCITTAIRRCRKNNRRTGYQEVSNIVV